jgi:hypothetical protein
VTENGEEDVSSYWITLRKQQEIEGERLDRTLWKTRPGRGYGRVLRQTRMNEGHLSHVVL